MSDEVMNNLLALLQNTMDGSIMTAENTMSIINGIGKGIQEDTRKMEQAVKRMEEVLQELSVLIGESLVLVPESVFGEGLARDVQMNRKETQTQSEQGKETYPVAFFYRSKVPGTHGTDGFYLVIDETEDELVYYVYDQNQKLVNTGKTDDKSLTVSAIEEMAINKEVLPYYSCYRMRPELIEVQVSIPVNTPDAKKPETNGQENYGRDLTSKALKEEMLVDEKEHEAEQQNEDEALAEKEQIEKEQRERPRAI